MTHLDATQVAALRARYADGGITQIALGRLFGIGQSQVSAIVRGSSWRPDSPRGSLAARFWRHVARGTADECWLWTGARNPGGYGVMGLGSRAEGTVLAHRVSIALHSGPIPAQLHVDHLCSVRLCVNPAHLEPVTQAENNRRSWARRKARLAA